MAPFASSPSLTAFAAQAVHGRTQSANRARALYDAFVRVLHDGKIVADKDNVPKARYPLTASALWDAAAANVRPVAGCYELTVLYIAAARAVGLDARASEPVVITDTGAIGHVLVDVSHGDGKRSLVDLQNRVFGRGDATRELSDAELTAHYYNQHAVAAFLRGELATAERDLLEGVAIADTVPQLASNYATLLATRGDKTGALTPAARAVSLAPKVAVYRYQLARLQIETGAVCAGLGQLKVALALAPKYVEARALARATLEASPQPTCAPRPVE